MEFNKILLQWYDNNKRDLPWRNLDNPYVIWIAEVVFQQTRIEQGLSYFLKFIDKFPSVHELSKATEEEVLKEWQGLGYYSRARNLHFSAKYIVSDLNGVFPSNYDDLLKLKGVGPYIAAEIAAVCFNEVVAAVDGNVQRVISRYFGVLDPVNEAKGAKLVKEIAQAHISHLRPGDFNQALMDFGSSICSPKKPRCQDCVFVESCWAFRNKMESDVPKKVKKLKIRNRYFNFILLFRNGKLAMERRLAGDVWQGLYQPILEETIKPVVNFSELSIPESSYVLLEEKSVLSHQNLFLKFWVIEPNDTNFEIVKMDWYNYEDLMKLPVPKSIEKLFLTKEFISVFKSA